MLTVGADIEVFVQDKYGNIASAIDYIDGNKYNPQVTTHGAVQYDNIMAEFNINPARSGTEFYMNTSHAYNDLKEVLAAYECNTLVVPSVQAPDNILRHPEARRFGCEADFCVWKMDVEHKVDALEIGNLRTAGGHVHIGWGSDSEINPAKQLAVAKACDLFLGLPSVLYDSDKIRRRHYGQAGHFRTKPYGVEYRVLSNFWIKQSKLIKWVFMQASMAHSNSNFMDSLDQKTIASILRAINTSDKKLAEKLVNQFEINMV